MYQKIIIKPILTEKMAILEERENKYAFIVNSDSNKKDIKSAVEEKFNVDVLKVSTMNRIGKKALLGFHGIALHHVEDLWTLEIL